MEKNLTKIFSAKIIPVIKITGMIGSGTEKDPVCSGVQYWDLEGNLIATLDPREAQEQIDNLDDHILPETKETGNI